MNATISQTTPTLCVPEVTAGRPLPASWKENRAVSPGRTPAAPGEVTLATSEPGRVGSAQDAAREGEPGGAVSRTGPRTGQVMLPVLRTSRVTVAVPVVGTSV